MPSTALAVGVYRRSLSMGEGQGEVTATFEQSRALQYMVTWHSNLQATRLRATLRRRVSAGAGAPRRENELHGPKTQPAPPPAPPPPFLPPPPPPPTPPLPPRLQPPAT